MTSWGRTHPKGKRGSSGGGLGHLSLLCPFVKASKADGVACVHDGDVDGDRQDRLDQAGRPKKAALS
jgi:hypothetical protein